MTSDNSKTKSPPAPTPSGKHAERRGLEAGGSPASSYSRGESQKPVTQCQQGESCIILERRQKH